MATTTIRAIESARCQEVHRPQICTAFTNGHSTIGLITADALAGLKTLPNDSGVPVVPTLHNYRFLCPAGTFLRQGKACEECATHSLFRGVWHRCYQESAAASAALALMLTIQRAFGNLGQQSGLLHCADGVCAKEVHRGRAAGGADCG